MVSASCSAQTLVIGLYDYSDLSAKETVRLTETADLAFADSGIHVVWLHCRGALVAPGTTCQRRTTKSWCGSNRADPAVPTTAERCIWALRSSLRRAGTTPAYSYRPSGRSSRKGVAFGLLMGYAAAHEAGHCLLGPGPSSAGLMSAAWNRKNAGELSRVSLHLTKQEARKAAARLVAEHAAQERRARQVGLSSQTEGGGSE
jgi:hypothetical protein